MEQLAVITGTFNPLTKAHISMGLLAQKKAGRGQPYRICPLPARFSHRLERNAGQGYFIR